MSNTNVDPAEIQKFNAIADEWWNAEGPFKPLHELNPLRLAFIQKYAVLKQKHVLDVGCGGGLLTEAMASCGAEVVGIDLATRAVEVAKAHLKKSMLEVNYLQTSVESFAEENAQSFEVITCMEMLEHVPDPLSVIKACTQLLKPGGLLFFSTVNRNIKSYLYAIVGAEWVMKLLPKGTHEYAKFIRPSELSQWSRQVGCEVKAIEGISYHPLFKTYSLSQDQSVNYLMCCEKLS